MCYYQRLTTTLKKIIVKWFRVLCCTFSLRNSTKTRVQCVNYCVASFFPNNTRTRFRGKTFILWIRVLDRSMIFLNRCTQTQDKTQDKGRDLPPPLYPPSPSLYLPPLYLFPCPVSRFFTRCVVSYVLPTRPTSYSLITYTAELLEFIRRRQVHLFTIHYPSSRKCLASVRAGVS